MPEVVGTVMGYESYSVEGELDIDSHSPGGRPDGTGRDRDELSFPDGFLWGAATSAYQIEGAVAEGGRGESIWDRYCRTPGAVENGDTGDVACDHYHRWREDVRLMQELGVRAYRLSISWPRIIPDGTGEVNREGVAHYRALLKELHDAGITPMVTLYHWDLPQALQERGGWENRDTVEQFDRYAQVCFEEFGDLVPHWCTINEPSCVSLEGNLYGNHAPGKRELGTALTVAHNVLLAHGRAVERYRATGQQGKIGIVLNLTHVESASDAREDLAAARRFDGHVNRWFLDPVFRGSYPDDMVAWYGKDAPEVTEGDMETISAPTDFLGVNYYFRQVIRDGPEGPVDAEGVPQGGEHTDIGWEVYPEGIHDILARIPTEYRDIPLYVTENGAAINDRVDADGGVHDTRRISYLQQHLTQVHRSIEDGADVRGYFAWSLMDNFEWALGYSQRFGLVHVDYTTQERTPKDSAHWYSDVIEHNGVKVEEHEEA